MNLLSSSALRAIREALPTGSSVPRYLGSSGDDAAESKPRGTEAPATEAPFPEAPLPEAPSLFVFRSGRARLFAAGADMAEMQRFSSFDAYEFARLGQELFDAIERLPCVTVALIDGDCFGGALDLVLSFDLRFATPRSRFAHPGAKLGIVTGFGGTSRWRKVLTRRAANQLFLANRVFSASEALEMGLVDRVAESHEEEVARIEAMPELRIVKTLTSRAHRLSASELLLLARRVGGVLRD